ncbi:MAG: efflux RND transporter periplasmic adaptor subunit [Planctomycetota bacterium]
MEALSPQAKLKRKAGLLLRLAIPVAALAAGVFAFVQLSIPPEQEEKGKKPERKIRTNVVELRRGDYEIIIEANGIIQPHNEVTLSAEVSGLVRAISPRLDAGAYFEEGDVLVTLDQRDYVTALDVVRAREKSAQAAESLAQQNFDRLRQLSTANNISDAEVAEAEAALKQAIAACETATAEVAQAERDLERTEIRAPFSGRVRAKTVGIGQSVGPGSPLAIAFAVDFAEVRLPLSALQQQRLKLPEFESDEPLPIVLRNAIGTEQDVKWNAEIVRTEGTLDADSLELFAIARIEDPFGRKSGDVPLRIGQPVTATIPGETLRNVVSLPRGAVRQLDQVFLVDNQEMTLSSRTVSPLWSNEEFVIVRDPFIENGDLLATTSFVYAPDGAKVEIIPDIELTASAAKPGANEASTN